MLEALRSLHGIDAAFVAATFILILAAWIVGVIFWQMHRAGRRQQVEVRLGLAEGAGQPGRALHLWHDGREATVHVPDAVSRPLLERLDLLCREAGWRISAAGLLLALFGGMLLLFVFASAWTGHMLAGAMTAVAIPLVTWVHLNRCISRRLLLFETQFLDALGLAARSLRAGHPLSESFRLISEELPTPVGPLFGRICQQQALGMDLEHALRQAASDAPSSELKLFATAVSIQLRTGGNLADLMDRLAEVIRDRMRLLRRVRVLTTQTQFSKRVLMVLPFLTLALLTLLNPSYMAPLYVTRLGQGMLVLGGVQLLLGGWLMNRMSVLRY